MPSLAYQRSISRAYQATINQTIEAPTCLRKTVPSRTIVDRYTITVMSMPRPDNWVRLLELLYYWPNLASEIIFNMELRRNTKLTQDRQKLKKQRQKAKAEAKKKATQAKKKAKKLRQKKKAQAQSLKGAIVGKKGKTLLQLFSHGLSGSKG